MTDIDRYNEEKSCVYKDEEYLVRDNGAILRKPPLQKKSRKLDNQWTFGKPDSKGHLAIGSVPVYKIVVKAFHGEAPTKKHVIIHLDDNKLNNSADNLRWATRLEQVVWYGNSREKVEFKIGVSIFEFLKNTSAYGDASDDPRFAWLKDVTEEEASACLKNIEKWYEIEEEKRSIIESLTPMAKQKNWGIPASFSCCPEKIEGDPIKCYMNNLSVDAKFATNSYGDSIIVKYALVEDNEIVVMNKIPSWIKPLALVRITYRDGFYLHTSLGSFFTVDGAEKRFTLEQGLGWTGGESIDDYC